MLFDQSEVVGKVHCRTGSLEISGDFAGSCRFVHCRTGSLEMAEKLDPLVHLVHCRTGSLEKPLTGA